MKDIGATIFDKKLAASSPFAISYESGNFEIEDVKINTPYGAVNVGGTTSISGQLEIDVSGEMEVGDFALQLQAIEKLGGRLIFNSVISGDIKSPEILASISVNDGMVRFKGFPYDLEEIESTMILSSEHLYIENLKGMLQESPFVGGGAIRHEKFIPKDIDLHLDIGETALTYPRWLSSRAKGRITVTGNSDEVILGGEIEVLRASYTENIELKLKDIIKKIRQKMIVRKDGEKKENKKLKLDFHFRADDSLFINNNLANAEFKGYLNLAGKVNELSLFGELETLRGKLYFRNREFSTSRGIISFADPERITPFFDITADAKIKDYNISTNLIGSPDDYKLEFSSDPYLEEKEIVSLITFGYTGNELEGKGTEMTSIEAASIILEGELESKVKKYFGFDRFQIDPYYSESAGSSEARVTVGKELRENLSATYSRGISTLEDEEVKLEYRLFENLSLEGSWTSTEEYVGSFGGDVILRYEFQ